MSSRKVPSLKLADYLSTDAAVKQKFIDDLYNSFKEYGFVVINNHAIDKELMNKAYEIQSQFFNLPLETKMKYFTNSGGQRGYTPFGTEHAKGYSVKDLKEFWHVGRDFDPQSPEYQIYPQNIWVDEIPEFKPVFSKIYAELEKTGQTLLEALTYSLEIPKDYFKETLGNGNSVLRLLHYPPIPEKLEKDQIRANAHSDINTVTLLISASAGGLQLLDKDKKWVNVESDPGSIIVNMGDMLSRMTNDILPSTIHRVVNPANGENVSRYSMPMFLHPKKGVQLTEFPKFKGQGKKYPDIESDDFLKERLKDIGLQK